MYQIVKLFFPLVIDYSQESRNHKSVFRQFLRWGWFQVLFMRMNVNNFFRGQFGTQF